ncbi:MAG: aldehyde dehydrogenase family protein, partial [Betaproteobacteria bacterium]|nr:aldehyde dehydrogenase family protein [Betaproteobacteria bacterium]
MKITNPATGAVIADVAADNAAAVRRKYEVARAGQVRWAKVPIRKRLDAIEKFRDRIGAMHETLARTLTHEVGKPIRQARNELTGLTARVEFFIAESIRALRDEKVFADPAQRLEERITHEPL